jgi:predicted dehydrogenase
LKSTEKVAIGIIGCGMISSIYLKNLQTFPLLDVLACADLDPQRTRIQAERFAIPKACTVEDLLADPELEIVLNLTIPSAHAEVGLAALQAGKHTYSEKPLGITLEQGKALLEAARTRDLRIGCAPDTFLGGGLQTCLHLINQGAIGRPVAATAFMACHGHENWHPEPDFYYQPGGGPLFDMGPYYLTALISLLGPVRRVTGSARITFPERVVTSKPRYGTTIKVNTPTHVAGVLDFANGAIGTLLMSFDVWWHRLPAIEIYGTEGTLSVPDPNGFSGPVRLRRANESAWQEVPLTHMYTDNSRGLGLLDMAQAIRVKRPHRASGELAYHVLEIMEALYKSSDSGQHIELQSRCERPEPLKPGELEGR